MNQARFGVFAIACLGMTGSVMASITSFNNWTLVEDPADPNFTGIVNNSDQITLSALGGPIPGAVDIGYQSINGATPATSTQGFAFDPAQGFSIAVDFALSFASANGDLAIGFGIGESSSGANSAGVALLTNDGVPFAFGGAARINDVTQPPAPLFAAPALTAAFFVTYDAGTGNITVGVGALGAAAPTTTTTFAGIQNTWNGDLLLASFFLRSESSLMDPWTSGTSDAVFSNFRVLTGQAIEVPTPGASLLLFAAGATLHRRRR